jgi:hypothetical protein
VLAPVAFFTAAVSLAAIPSYWNSEIWSTWHFKSLLPGVLDLAHSRGELNKHNLHDTYVGARPQTDCSGWEKRHYRQADGTCNDLPQALDGDPFNYSRMGAAGERFGRSVRDLSRLSQPTDDEILRPNPLVISRELMARPSSGAGDDSYREVPWLNLFAASWIQFEVHDWLSHGENMNEPQPERFRPFRVIDTLAGPMDLSELIVPRSQYDTLREADNPGYPTYVNENTHWWDGSQLYGSSRALVSCAADDWAVTLRECRVGRLKLDEHGNIPVDPVSGKEKTGFTRNWWVGLDLLHVLFARNHNWIAAKLQEAYPGWDDERLFQTARLINAAVMAKIHTVEWTPAILKHPIVDFAMRTNWYGVEKAAVSSHLHAGAVGVLQRGCRVVEGAAPFLRELCPILGGLVGDRLERYGAPFQITEEFTSVYRLHSLLPENLDARNEDGSVEEIPLSATSEQSAHAVLERKGATELMVSFGLQHPGQLVLGNYPRFLRNLSVVIPGSKLKFDMAAVDVIRDRERGVPRYNEFRRQLNLPPIHSFEDLMPLEATPQLGVDEAQASQNREFVRRLEDVYGGDVEQLDLLPGTLAEGYRPAGFGFGETMFQIFILMASRRLQADRFYTIDYNAATYSRIGLDIIDQATLKSVIEANFPEIPAGWIPTNAFYPWHVPSGAKPGRVNIESSGP